MLQLLRVLFWQLSRRILRLRYRVELSGLEALKQLRGPTLVMPNHPLMARVTVNRIWQQYFGVGLVKTAEDFGLHGEPPSHPALLDWLAVEFRERGWNVKHLHKLLVMSRTYQQTSKADKKLAEVDPGNRLLARQTRFRLSPSSGEKVPLQRIPPCQRLSVMVRSRMNTNSAVISG